MSELRAIKDRVIEEAVRRLGTKAEVARQLGVAAQNFRQWHKVPPRHVPKLAKITGMDRIEIRPDVYADDDQ